MLNGEGRIRTRLFIGVTVNVARAELPNNQLITSALPMYLRFVKTFSLFIRTFTFAECLLTRMESLVLVQLQHHVLSDDP